MKISNVRNLMLLSIATKRKLTSAGISKPLIHKSGNGWECVQYTGAGIFCASGESVHQAFKKFEWTYMYFQSSRYSAHVEIMNGF